MSTCRADQWPVVPEEGGRELHGCEAATHSERKVFFLKKKRMNDQWLFFLATGCVVHISEDRKITFSKTTS